MESNFGIKLREIRERKGMTVNQLAVYSEVSSALISKIENGIRRKPKPETIEKLAKGLKMEYEELMYIAGYIDKENKKNRDKDTVVYNDANTTIRLLEEESKKMGLSPDDPAFKKMLADAFELIRLARRKDME